MTGSANDRFLMRSVRSGMPNSINTQLDPQMLINRRIENHEKRIKNENKNNKVIYEIGARVRLQDVKTKLFSQNGTVIEQRNTDSGTIVSYVIKTDRGRITTRHRKFMRRLEIENDPTIRSNNTNLDTPDIPVADSDILKTDATSAQYSGPKATDQADSEVVVKRRSSRIKARGIGKGVSKLKVSKVNTASINTSSMGSSCSSQLEELKTKNKRLENRIALYEKGITDKSIHASQTNFGLLTIANEDNTECSCNSSGSLFGVMEIVAVLMAVLFVLYILYGCVGRYIIYRRNMREKRRNKLLLEVETRMGKVAGDAAIEMSPCQKLHVPDYQTKEATFDH